MTNKRYKIFISLLVVAGLFIFTNNVYAADGDPCDVIGVCGSPECAAGEVCTTAGCMESGCSGNFETCSGTCCDNGDYCQDGVCVNDFTDQCFPIAPGECEDSCGTNPDTCTAPYHCDLVAPGVSCANPHYECVIGNGSMCSDECVLYDDSTCPDPFEECMQVNAGTLGCTAPPNTYLRCMQVEASCEDRCDGPEDCSGGSICGMVYPDECPEGFNDCTVAECFDQCSGQGDCAENYNCEPVYNGSCGTTLLQCVYDSSGGGGGGGGNPGDPFPGINPEFKIVDPFEFLQTVGSILFPAGLAIGGFYIVKSGWCLGTSQGDPKKVQECQGSLTSAILGVIFLLLSVAILRIIISTVLGGTS